MFLDMLVHRQNGKCETKWYLKPTDTGLCMSFYAVAPTRYKRNIVEGMIHRISNATSNWLNFFEGLEKAKSIWEANQYPPDFYEPIVKSVVEKLVSGGPSGSPPQSNQVEETRTKRSVLILQYRGKISDRLAKRIRQGSNVSVIFTTRKLRSSLPSLKGRTEDVLKSRVVYELCEVCYVGQTVRQLTTRLKEHHQPSSTVGQHIQQCGENARISSRIIDGTSDCDTLMTLEALYIDRLKPGLNQREEYRTRQLTLRL